MNKLAGKTAVITGGNSGIGLATARLFVAEGARVIIVGRRAEAVDAATGDLGETATGFVGDAADPATHRRVMEYARDQFGMVDIYFANAGINMIAPSGRVTIEDYEAQFAVNTRAVFVGVQEMMPVLNDGGVILLTSSIASTKVLEGHAVYAGSKAAIEAFARSWAIELKGQRIRVNVLSPGPVDTPILDKIGITRENRPSFETALSQAIPLGRLGAAEEVARAALFLASDDASFITGVNLAVDGGMLLG